MLRRDIFTLFTEASMSRWGLASLALLLLACTPDGRRPSGRPETDGGGLFPAADEDGDNISDDNEDRGDGVDTDGDGTADYVDDDSDGDGVRDAAEAGVDTAALPPVDTDGDGTPDFRDLESDGNGILDSIEGGEDLDGDGEVNSRDLDNDGDRIGDLEEIGGSPESPIDTDADGAPDYLDFDSDEDTIGDRDESVFDSDMDGVADRFDRDSDGDGYSDPEEAGDADFMTPPVDTDSDTIPDYRDADSDADGLGDAEERTLGTNPRNADTDGDTVSDLVEIAACPPGDTSCAMDATDPTSSIRTRGGFYFFEPYMMPPDPPRDTLDFATDIRVADIYFAMDTTGSMGTTITSLRTGLSTPGTGLIDRVRAAIPDTWFGVGDFRDNYDTWVYRHVQDMTVSTADAQTAANSLVAGGGGDIPEGDVPTLYSIASGLGVVDPGATDIPDRMGCPAGTWGYPCFRDGAVPIVVLMTDAPFHNGRGGTNPYGGYTTYDVALAALNARGVRVIGIAVGSGGLVDLQNIATDTGAVDGGGAPLASVWTSGTPISDAVVTQIQTLASSTELDISTEFVDDPTDAVDTFAAFVDHLEANIAGDAARGCAALPGADMNGDGVNETFPNVRAGTRVCFDIVTKTNALVMPTEDPQLFRAEIRVIGDGFTELDRRTVYFLVPPVPPAPGGID
jgi:hypothetical protein